MREDPHEAQLDARLDADERRMAMDEQRLAVDEQRLLADEARIEATEQETVTERRFTIGVAAFAGVLGIALLALVLAVVGLRSDVNVLGRTAPDDTVDTAALRDQSVTTAKLVPGAVTAEALARGAVTAESLANGAVGPAALAPGSVQTAQVPANALTGADISERTLRTVPSARDAERLGDLPATAYLASPVLVRETSVTNAQRVKGPLVARCPVGTRVLSGGAAIEGAATGASLVRNTPDGTTAWTATAQVSRTPPPSWRLVVTAMCATGGG